METVAAAAPTLLSGLALAGLLGVWATLLAFVRGQRRANAANAKANRAMQREVIHRMFREHVERGEPATPDDMEQLEYVFEAYSANGGNGTARLMYERVKERARIVT